MSIYMYMLCFIFSCDIQDKEQNSRMTKSITFSRIHYINVNKKFPRTLADLNIPPALHFRCAEDRDPVYSVQPAPILVIAFLESLISDLD